MVESRLDEIDFQVRLHGGDPDAGDTDKPVTSRKGKVKEQMARKYIEDPFRDFPHDVDFSILKSQDVDRMIQAHERLKDEAAKIGKPLTQKELDTLWTTERKTALEGEDPLAKRAAVRSELWAIYQRLKRNGCEPTKEILLQCVRMDWAAFKLFPTDTEIRTRQKLERKAGYQTKEPPVTAGADTVPMWHGQNLFSEGRLSELLNDFNQACGFSATKSGLHATDVLGKPKKG